MDLANHEIRLDLRPLSAVHSAWAVHMPEAMLTNEWAENIREAGRDRFVIVRGRLRSAIAPSQDRGDALFLLPVDGAF